MIKFQMKFIFLWLLSFSSIHALQLDRVILATDDNPNYIQFWPLAAKAWQEIVGVRPTLALIAPPELEIDESLGDVIRFEPIEGVPTSFYAQCIRLFLPCLFPNDGCIVSDIDLLPLQKKFFTKKIRKMPDDSFVIYKDRAYWFYKPRIHMNYNAAKGSTFQEIFGITTKEEIANVIKTWYRIGFGWSTDEKFLYNAIKNWSKQKNNRKRLKKLGYDNNVKQRISRSHNLKHSKKKLKKQYYVEVNCARPYLEHKEKIDSIMQIAFLAAQKKNK